jgi:hypothetical protein
MNQTAQNLASYGRNGDTTLVHMSPQEVSGLQTLARNNGTTMTINPHTGLPEAFSLGRLLPMIAGFALGPAGLGMSAMQAGLAAGALGTLATGSLREGIGIGLGAAGGAGLAGSMSNLAAPASAGLPANAVAGSPGIMGGAGSGITIPTNAINAAGPGQLVNPAYMPQVGLNANTMALPPLETTAGTNFGLTTATAPVTNYSLTSGTQLPSLGASNATNAANSQFSLNSVTSNAPQSLRLNAMGAPTSSMTAVPPDGTLAKGLTDLDALKQAEVSRNFGQTGLRTLPSSVNAQGFATSSEPIVSDLGSGYSGTLKPPPEMVSLKGPTMTDRFNRVVAGGEKAFGSMDAAGEFLGNNKMNLAMASAPMFLEEPEPLPEEESYIRPYSLDVENTSDRPASALGREEERLRYKYTAGTPYRAAQGGIIAFAQGGNMPDGQEMNTNPAMMRRMDEMQIPPFAGIMDPSRMKEIYGMGSSGGQGYAEGGETGRREVRKKINRMDDPYAFAAYQSGRGLYDAALQNFAAGGLSNVPRFLSGGGDGMSDSIPASINDRQPARLADGEFVIPADVVSHLGNGSSKAGAKQLYAMMDRIRTKRTGKKKQAPAVNPRKTMPA